MTKIELLEKSLLESDNIAFIPIEKSDGKYQLMAINISKMSSRAIIEFDGTIVAYRMSTSMLKRTIEVFNKNKKLLEDKLKERINNQKI